MCRTERQNRANLIVLFMKSTGITRVQGRSAATWGLERATAGQNCLRGALAREETKMRKSSVIILIVATLMGGSAAYLARTWS